MIIPIENVAFGCSCSVGFAIRTKEGFYNKLLPNQRAIDFLWRIKISWQWAKNLNRRWLLDEVTGRQISTNDRTNSPQTTEQNCHKRPKICFNACIIKTKPIRVITIFSLLGRKDWMAEAMWHFLKLPVFATNIGLASYKVVFLKPQNL